MAPPKQVFSFYDIRFSICDNVIGMACLRPRAGHDRKGWTAAIGRQSEEIMVFETPGSGLGRRSRGFSIGTFDDAPCPATSSATTTWKVGIIPDSIYPAVTIATEWLAPSITLRRSTH